MKLSKKITAIAIATVTMSAISAAVVANTSSFNLTRATGNNTYSCNDIVFSETVSNPGSYTDISNLASMGVTNLDCSMTNWTNANYLNNATSSMSDSAIKIGGSKAEKYSGSVTLTLHQDMTASRVIVYATGWNNDTGTIKLGVNGTYQTITKTTDYNYVFTPYTFDLGGQTNQIIFTNDNEATGSRRVVISKIVLRLYNEALISGDTPVDPPAGDTTTVERTDTSPLSTTAENIDSNITIKVSSANTYSAPIRVYANTTVTINALNSHKIVSVTYKASSTGNYVTYASEATVSPSVTPTVDGKNVTWTFASGTTEFTFKPSSQTRTNGFIIIYE